MKKILFSILIIFAFMEYFSCLSYSSPGMMGNTGKGAASGCTTSCNGTTYTNSETCCWFAAATAASVTVKSLTAVDAAYTLAKDGTNGFTILHWASARFSDPPFGLENAYNKCTPHGTSSYVPVYTASVKNSQPGWVFTGSYNEYFDCGNVGLASSHSGFIVGAGSSSNIAFRGLIALYPTSGNRFYLGADTNSYIRFYTSNAAQSNVNLVTSPILNTSATFYLWSYKLSATWAVDGFYYNNNSSIGSSSTYSLTPAGNDLQIGGFTIDSLYGYWTIPEWLFISGEFTSGQFTAIKNYENGIWALW
jgi:hypothetical protein